MAKKTASNLPPPRSKSIRDYFKPFVSQTSNHVPSKRSADEEPTVNSRGSQSPRAKSPKLNIGHHLHRTGFETPSDTSTLSSIGTNDTPEPPPLDTPEQPPQALQENVPSSHLDLSSTTLPTGHQVRNERTVDVRKSSDESDSDGSLEDLDELLTGGKAAKSSSPLMERASSDPEHETLNSSTRKSSLRNTARARSSVKNNAPSDREWKFSLGTLLEQIEKGRAEDEAYERALKVVNQLEAQNVNSNTGNTVKISEGLTAQTLAAKIKVDDPDDVDKLVSALSRTEALQSGPAWSFFDRSPMDANVPKFPNQSFDQSASSNRLPSDQKIAFLNGVASQAAIKNTLPQAILDWIIDYGHYEPQEEMCKTYNNVMSSAKFQLSELLDLKRLDAIMENLGVSSQVRDVQSKIDLVKSRARAQSLTRNKEEDRIVQQFLRATVTICRILAPEVRAQMLYHLLYMSFDEYLMSDAEIHHLQQDAIAACFDNKLPSGLTEKPFRATRIGSSANRLETSDNDKVASLVGKSMPSEEVADVLPRIYEKTDNLGLQLQLIKNFPLSTSRLVKIRRRLSLAFLFKDKSYLNEAGPKPPGLSGLAGFLRGQPFFKVRQKMDFQHLGDFMSLLDIVVDDGDPPENLHDTEIEKRFNKEVDELSKVIREMTSRIVDTSASDMVRTETKEIMVALEARLHYAVRTKPRPKKSLFGEVRNVEESKFMKKYVKSTAPLLDKSW